MTTEKVIILRTGRADLGDAVFPQPLRLAALPRVPVAHSVEVLSVDTRDLASLRRDPDVLSIAPVAPMKLIAPTETREVDLSTVGNASWGITAVGADRSTYNGAGVTVAVLDTGINREHPAFNGINIIEREFVNEGPGDLNGHGSHCAGTIFGRDVQGVRIGVAPGVGHALIGKVLDRDGRGTLDGIVQAIEWAEANGADVISMSLGFDYAGLVDSLVGQGWPTDLAASRALWAHRGVLQFFDSYAAVLRSRINSLNDGAVVVAAAGNESRRRDNPDYRLYAAPPAAADGFISVGAIGEASGMAGDFEVAEFSNIGCNVTAPGVGIVSVKATGGLATLSGTSMATPHVAGVAALWIQRAREHASRVEFERIRAQVVGNARHISGFDELDIGAGLVQAPAI